MEQPTMDQLKHFLRFMCQATRSLIDEGDDGKPNIATIEYYFFGLKACLQRAGHWIEAQEHTMLLNVSL
jgi:hypothetical protein